MDELIERVDLALRAGYPGAPNGRVREVPDRRAIRWYTSIGLVDRPLGMRGRTALYGPRHLRQLVAVKRLQARGRALSDIQAELSLSSDENLDRIADVPPDLLADDDGATPDESLPPARFWARQPAADTTTEPAHPPAGPPGLVLPAEPAAVPAAEPEAVPAAEPEAVPAAESGTGRPAEAISGGGAADWDRQPAKDTAAGRPAAGGVPEQEVDIKVLTGIDLGAGVLLVLPRPVPPSDLGAIAGAAAPLLTLLAARGLIDGSPS